MVLMDMEGIVVGQGRPSSEWRLHLDIYVSRQEAGAVLHAHSPWCTTLACMDREIPAFHYMVAMAGGDSIRCASYAVFGSRKLSRQVQLALHERSACLMSHHGMICFADTPAKALDLAVEVENLARIYCQVLQIGKPSLLDRAQMHKVMLKFSEYRSTS
jgi:L-fuculose-phosphate aldolase